MAKLRPPPLSTRRASIAAAPASRGTVVAEIQSGGRAMTRGTKAERPQSTKCSTPLMRRCSFLLGPLCAFVAKIGVSGCGLVEMQMVDSRDGARRSSGRRGIGAGRQAPSPAWDVSRHVRRPSSWRMRPLRLTDFVDGPEGWLMG
jgi:hypothetical protein